MRAAAAAAVVKWQNGGQDYQGEALESTALSISGNIAIFLCLIDSEKWCVCIILWRTILCPCFHLLVFHPALLRKSHKW